jgi:hypothetical protein
MMDQLMQYLTSNQTSVTIVVVLILFTFYFIFKKLVKLALIFVLILLCVGGYLYIKDPDRVKQSIQQTRERTTNAIQKGKDAYKDGKALYEKSKKLPKEIDEMIGKVKEKKAEQ